MTAALVAGVLAGYGIAVPVGAIGALLVGLTARTSLKVGAAAAMGVATADGIYAVVAMLGGSAVTGVIEPVATPMKWLAAVILLALAGRTAYTALLHHRNPARAVDKVTPLSPGRAFFTLLGLTILNPATIVYFGALVLGRQSADPFGPAEQVVFVAAAFAASASWQLLLAGGGSLIGRTLTTARGRLVTALVSSTVIGVLAVLLLVT